MPLYPSAIAEQDGHPRLVVGPEHEVVDEELREALSEEVVRAEHPFIGLESVLLVNPDPRQL